MNKQKLLLYSIFNSIGVFLYIIMVALLTSNAESIFGKMTNFWGPVVLLLLFVLSATIVGSLVLGRPIYLYLNGSKPDAIRLLFYTIGWLFVIIVIVLLIQLMF